MNEFGLIHINGRIYDPTLARFLQADPFVEDTGTLNRYTYVHNNPLMYTDPSGYFSSPLEAFKAIVSIAIAVAVPASAGLWVSMLAGAASGAILTGSVEGALWGAFSGAVFWNIGNYFNGVGQGNAVGSDKLVFGTKLKAGQFAAQTVSHATAGGVISEMQGWKFGHGFLSAGVSKGVTQAVVDGVDDVFLQAAINSTVGGTVSEATAGKFANGAATAAMAYAFNQMTQSEKEAVNTNLTCPVFSEVRCPLSGGL